MNIYECERYAKENMDSDTRFILLLRNESPKSCKWIDAHFGSFAIEGENGFLMSYQVQKMTPNHECVIVPPDGESNS